MSEAPKIQFEEAEGPRAIVSPDLGHTAGIVVEAKKGRSFRPIFKNSSEKWREEFGNPDITFSPNAYEAITYLDSARRLYTVRVHNGGKLANALIGIDASGASATGSGLGEDETGIDASVFAGEAFSVIARSAGVHGNDLTVSVANVDAGTKKFDIIVKLNGTQVESFTVSRIQQVDASGIQLYLEDRINDVSEYIIVEDNLAVDENTVPEAVADLALGGGDDGSAVTVLQTHRGRQSWPESAVRTIVLP